MPFTANTHSLGCLPDGEVTEHETAAEAWRSLIESMGDLAWEPDDEADPDGPHSTKLFVIHMEQLERADKEGSVFGDGVVWEVEFE